MNLPPTLINNQRGFTLVEILIVMAIFAALATMSSFLDLTFYRGNSFSADYDMFVAVTQRVRARAINNINESKHGVYIDADKYILFEGASYATATVTEEITRNSNVSLSGVSEVVFSQLSGDSNFNGDIVLSDGFRTSTISINNEGQISW